MNPVPLFLLAISLPLLLGGCGEKESVGEVKSVEEKVLEVKEEVNFIEFKELEKRDDGLHYKRGDKSPYSGKAYDVSLSGNKKEEGSFKNGLKDGLWIEWDNLQRKTSQVHYRGGKLHGISVHWGPVSRELSRENYEEGKLVELPEKAAGLVNLSDLRMGLDGLRFPSSNKPFSGAVFSLHYSNGEKYQQGTLAEGKRDGVWLEWYENGVKNSELTYKSGKLISSLTWKPNGEKSKNGIINGNGILKSWHENGKLMVEKKIVAGNELVIRGWDSDGKFLGSKFSNYYKNLDTKTFGIESRIESKKEHILELENEIPKDEAKKHFKKYYLELSELEKKLTQIKTEISSIKEIKEQWDKEANAE